MAKAKLRDRVAAAGRAAAQVGRQRWAAEARATSQGLLEATVFDVDPAICAAVRAAAIGEGLTFGDVRFILIDESSAITHGPPLSTARAAQVGDQLCALERFGDAVEPVGLLAERIKDSDDLFDGVSVTTMQDQVVGGALVELPPLREGELSYPAGALRIWGDGKPATWLAAGLGVESLVALAEEKERPLAGLFASVPDRMEGAELTAGALFSLGFRSFYRGNEPAFAEGRNPQGVMLMHRSESGQQGPPSRQAALSYADHFWGRRVEQLETDRAYAEFARRAQTLP